MAIEALRTPDERFCNLTDFPFEPHYLDDLQDGLRMAYIDEGPRDAEHVYLCLHGEPSWSYLYRKMLPVFVASGGRVVCPDLFGFGRSDKPVDDGAYSYGFHRRSVVAFVEALGLERFTLVCQDWGGILGLSLPLTFPERIAGLIAMNTTLPTGEVSPGVGFEAWKNFVASQPDFDVGGLMARAIPGLDDAGRAAYEAPFPDARYKAGVRTFPALVPVTTDMEGAAESKQALAWWSTEWSGPSFIAAGALDPVLGVPAMKFLRRAVRGAPDLHVLDDAGHFTQEAGAPLAEAALRGLGRTSD